MTDRVIRVIVDDREASAGLDRIDGKLDRVDKSADRVAKSSNNLAKWLTAVAGAITVDRVIAYADAWTQTESQLRLVTESQEQLLDVQERLLTSANDTRSAYASTVELYARLTRSTEDLNLSDSRRLKLTETVNKAIQVSGASAQEASNGIIQFSQALSAGTLRGQDLNSVMAQTPRLARAIADGLGVSIGRLREMGAAGTLTAESVLTALETQAPKIAEEFEKLEPTVAQAGTVLRNQLLAVVGELNKATGATSSLAAAVIDAAGDLDDLARAVTGNLRPGDEMAETTARLAQSLIAVETTGRVVAKLISTGVTTAFDTAGAAIGGVVAALDQLTQTDIENLGSAFLNILRASRPLSALGDTIGQVTAALVQLAQGNFTAAFDIITDVDADGYIRRADEAAEELQRTLDDLAASQGVRGALDVIAEVGTDTSATLRAANDEIMQIADTIEGGVNRIAAAASAIRGTPQDVAASLPVYDPQAVIAQGRTVTEKDVLAAIEQGGIRGRSEFGAPFGAPAVQEQQPGQVVEINFSNGERFRVIAPDEDAGRLGSALEEEARRAGAR